MHSCHTIIAVTHQHSNATTVLPRFIEAVQVDIGKQGGGDSPNAIANFEFEVALDYRRGERLFSKPRQRSTTMGDVKGSM
jgi:hypothetical protein